MQICILLSNSHTSQSPSNKSVMMALHPTFVLRKDIQTKSQLQALLARAKLLTIVQHIG